MGFVLGGKCSGSTAVIYFGRDKKFIFKKAGYIQTFHRPQTSDKTKVKMSNMRKFTDVYISHKKTVLGGNTPLQINTLRASGKMYFWKFSNHVLIAN